METQVNRHGFITFWLWLGIVVNIINIPLQFVFNSSINNLGMYGIQLMSAGIDISSFHNHVLAYMIILNLVMVLNSVALCIGYRLLLGQIKKGFTINAISSAVCGLISVCVKFLIEQEYQKLGLSIYNTSTLILYVLFIPISILILWAILQIRKNGVSYWSQLCLI